jgi:glycerate 2-kinase
MKIVVAPDSFKETLGAEEVAQAIAVGVLRACPEANVDVCPMADGGEGTVDAMVAATGGRIVAADVFDPLGRPMRSRFGMLGGGAERTAVVEMAAASGLALVPPELRDPLRTTTFGTGQLMLAALDEGAERIVVGVGGSATTDGGCGAAQALGVLFLEESGRPCVCGLAGGGLESIAKIDLADRDPRLADVDISVACDVTNPLTGPDGAAAVYSPQKGATAETVRRLEAGLAHLAELLHRDMGVNVEHMSGAGAAGGLAAGLVAFAGAKLTPGLDLVADTVALADRLAGADLCITGEGMLDAQSLAGKTAVGVARLAATAGVPVVCIPGQFAREAATDLFTASATTELFAAVAPLVADDISPEQAMREPAKLLRQRAAEAVAAFIE